MTEKEMLEMAKNITEKYMDSLLPAVKNNIAQDPATFAKCYLSAFEQICEVLQERNNVKANDYVSQFKK